MDEIKNLIKLSKYAMIPKFSIFIQKIRKFYRK